MGSEMCIRDRDKGHKLKFRWFGPRRITSVHGPLVYGFTLLRGGNAERVHCARLLLYRDSLLGTTVPDEVLDLADRTESRYEIADRITDIGDDHDGIFLRIQWDGLPDERDWTWHPLHELHSDIPEMVQDFLSSFPGKSDLVSEAKRQLSII